MEEQGPTGIDSLFPIPLGTAFAPDILFVAKIK